MAMVVLVRGTKSSRLSRERRGRRDEACRLIRIPNASLPNSTQCITYWFRKTEKQWQTKIGWIDNNKNDNIHITRRVLTLGGPLDSAYSFIHSGYLYSVPSRNLLI